MANVANELIDFLRNKTHFGRLTISEVKETLARLEAEGYVLEKKVVTEVKKDEPVVAAEAPKVEGKIHTVADELDAFVHRHLPHHVAPLPSFTGS